MPIFKVLIILVCSILLLDNINGRKLVNKYPCHGVFGKPGSGKTTYLNKIAYEYQKKKWSVHTDFGTTVPNVQQFSDSKFKAGKWLPDGRAGYPCWYDSDHFSIDRWLTLDTLEKADLIKQGHCGPINETDVDNLIIIDEIGTLLNNRDFRTNFSNVEFLRWWKEHRHRRCMIVYASQVYKDMDAKVRPLTDTYFLIKRSFLKCFSYAKPILVSIDITNNENSDNAGGQIIDIYKYAPIFSWRFILLPRWIKKFNSFA